MHFSCKENSIIKRSGDCLVVAVYREGELSPLAAEIDLHCKQQLSRLTAGGDLTGKVGDLLLIPEIEGLAASRLLLVGAGSLSEGCSEQDYRKLCQTVAAEIKRLGYRHIVSTINQIEVPNRDLPWKIGCETAAFTDGHYRFDQLKTAIGKEEGEREEEKRLEKVTLSVKKRDSAVKRAVQIANALDRGTTLARDLGNLPGNLCTPSHLAATAEGLAAEFPLITTTILDEKEMKKLGMGALLSVSRGSREPAKLIVMEYHGRSGNADKALKQPVALVGKGLTFDAGGISLKPAAAMDEMKYDMAGGAAVFGTLRAIALLKPKLDLVAVIPCSENLPDGAANKPGDIVTSMSGQTIEILNTDAEGRLILCDALTYVGRYQPKTVIDIATLTGAVIVALGHHASGVLGNDDSLLKDLQQAGDASDDRIWPLPMWDEYDQQLKSPFADIANIGGKSAGTITAACFLSRFTQDYRWAHLDIAGTAWRSGDNKGATGRPVPLLTHYLLNQL
ncbi:MAG: leucyl aminopeptidase [Gammaproteobacteria bacterium]|nr:leucyl aminopeptidase [Gammaproteobacteria bacterium]